ncbi:MAG: hypothetical protein LQ340_004372 [Diploschistes diacapsis]|nr:MAG: hypothetical protein LQ340_004372 [Diploschistes diacapsis]
MSNYFRIPSLIPAFNEKETEGQGTSGRAEIRLRHKRRFSDLHVHYLAQAPRKHYALFPANGDLDIPTDTPQAALDLPFVLLASLLALSDPFSHAPLRGRVHAPQDPRFRARYGPPPLFDDEVTLRVTAKIREREAADSMKRRPERKTEQDAKREEAEEAEKMREKTREEGGLVKRKGKGKEEEKENEEAEAEAEAGGPAATRRRLRSKFNFEPEERRLGRKGEGLP